jgi:hypothetical protein
VFPASAEEREAGEDQLPVARARGDDAFALPRGEDAFAGPASAEACLRRMSVLPQGFATAARAGPVITEADALLVVLATGPDSSETTSPAGFFSTHLVFVGRGESGPASAEATGATMGSATEVPSVSAKKCVNLVEIADDLARRKLYGRENHTSGGPDRAVETRSRLQSAGILLGVKIDDVSHRNEATKTVIPNLAVEKEPPDLVIVALINLVDVGGIGRVVLVPHSRLL